MMDNEQERNEHFKCFADLVAQEIEQLEERVVPGTDLPISQGHWQEAIRDIIAQRAYDLVKHATEHINKNAIYTEHPRFDAFMLAIVPDLTEWPTQQQP